MRSSIKDYKTLCCKAGYYRKGRADYRCEKCGKDVTMELALLQITIKKDEK